MSTKVLLDTDIGTDIDDAVCLAYLLSHPECELLGITTVTGEPEQRAMIASAICTAAGKKVPIYPGAAAPLIVSQRQTRAEQAAALSKWDHETAFPKGEAVEFLRHTIRRHPGEITLLTIAPLTNIGMLFSADPEIPSLLNRLVMMCGRFTDRVEGNYGRTEWNAAGDPHATRIVYDARIKAHRSVGLDVTSRVTMGAEEFRQRFRRYAIFGPVLDFAEIWFQQWGGTTFHDPLAASTIFDEGICAFHRGRVDIEMRDEELLGLTQWTGEDPRGPHEVALEVDVPRFFHEYCSVFH